MKRAETVRWLKRAVKSFPETAPRKIVTRMNALKSRRAHNKIGRRSRKKNRHG